MKFQILSLNLCVLLTNVLYCDVYAIATPMNNQCVNYERSSKLLASTVEPPTTAPLR